MNRYVVFSEWQIVEEIKPKSTVTLQLPCKVVKQPNALFQQNTNTLPMKGIGVGGGGGDEDIEGGLRKFLDTRRGGGGALKKLLG